VEKYSRAEQATDDVWRMRVVLLKDKGCRHTLRIRNSHCLSAATVVARTRLNIKFIRTLRVLFLMTTVSVKPLAVFAPLLRFSATLRLQVRVGAFFAVCIDVLFCIFLALCFKL
jgi:hypothetical protein